MSVNKSMFTDIFNTIILIGSLYSSLLSTRGGRVRIRTHDFVMAGG